MAVATGIVMQTSSEDCGVTIAVDEHAVRCVLSVHEPGQKVAFIQDNHVLGYAACEHGVLVGDGWYAPAGIAGQMVHTYAYEVE